MVELLNKAHGGFPRNFPRNLLNAKSLSPAVSETVTEPQENDGIELPEIEIQEQPKDSMLLESEKGLPDLSAIKRNKEIATGVLKAFTGSSGDFGTEQHINNIIANLSKMEDLETLTDLDSKEIVAITRLLWYSFKYHSKSGILLAQKLLQTKVSKDRGGRTELVQALIGAFRMEIEKAQTKKVEV